MIINIFGSSGSGKTTLIREITGLNLLNSWFCNVSKDSFASPSTDTFAISCMPVPKYRGRVDSYFRLFGIDFGHAVTADLNKTALLESIFPEFSAQNVSMLSGRQVESLSAGEGRRLAILRCLSLNAAVSVVDEPFANSDSALHQMIYRTISLSGKSVILTHAPVEFDEMNDKRLICISIVDARNIFKRVINECKKFDNFNGSQ